jgi:carbon monoxide dehydrogenase subunit G
LKAVGRGADLGKAGTFTQETTVNLVEVSEDSVEISYRTNVSLVGRLATFGDRTLRAKAKELEAELTHNFQERLRSEVAASGKT